MRADVLDQEHEDVEQRLDQAERRLEEHARRLRLLELELGVYDAVRDQDDDT